MGWGVSDHPRSRGEYRGNLLYSLSVPGSSPLSRGIQMADPDTCNVPGSSPLSRGIHTLLRQGEHELWIIPALAGNTSRPPTGMAAPADHPRSRGEYGAWARYHTGTDGSSPLSRGIQAHACTLRQASRIIPALAGNTQSRQRDRVHLQDHPRSRGEYWEGSLPVLDREGSSPLSRGIQPRRELQ